MSALSDLFDAVEVLLDDHSGGGEVVALETVEVRLSLARDELAEIHEALGVPAHLSLVEHARAMAEKGE